MLHAFRRLCYRERYKYSQCPGWDRRARRSIASVGLGLVFRDGVLLFAPQGKVGSATMSLILPCQPSRKESSDRLVFETRPKVQRV